MMDPESARLTYERLTPERTDEFHRLAIDDHIRRYLLDGDVVDRDWCARTIASSEAMFASRSVGLWLLAERDAPTRAIGFAGFHVFEEIGPEPELAYALLEPYTGRGYAFEAAHAVMAFAERSAGVTMFVASVDEPNVASIRILEKLGFQFEGTRPGDFGAVFMYRRLTTVAPPHRSGR